MYKDNKYLIQIGELRRRIKEDLPVLTNVIKKCLKAESGLLIQVID